MNGRHPQVSLRVLLERIADHPINRIGELALWNVRPNINLTVSRQDARSRQCTLMDDDGDCRPSAQARARRGRRIGGTAAAARCGPAATGHASAPSTACAASDQGTGRNSARILAAIPSISPDSSIARRIRAVAPVALSGSR